MKLEDLERDILCAYLNYENNDFKLKPTFKKLKIDNIDYVIPEIEIYNYSPEKLGLKNLN